MALRSLPFYLKVYILRWLTRLSSWLDRRRGPAPRPPRPSRIISIPSTLSGSPGTFDIYFYFPPGYEHAAQEKKTYPVVATFHGGGWCVAHARDDERFFSTLTSRGAVVASVNYRLAPEHPYPVPIEDCLDALLYIWRHATSLGVDKDRTIIAGFSAGGQMAFTALLMLWKLNLAKDSRIDTSILGTVRGITAFYPSMDLTKSRDERASSNPAFVALKRKPASSSKLVGSIFDKAFFWNLKEVPDKSFIYLSPGLAPVDALGEALPKRIYFKLAGQDYLLAEGRAAADRLNSLGKQVRCETIEDVPHYWDHMAGTEEMRKLRDTVHGKAADEIKQMWEDENIGVLT